MTADRKADGRIMSQYGKLVRPFDEYPAEEVRTLLVSLAEEMEDLKASLGLETYLCYGMLLGLVREGDLIPHDWDFDIAFHIPTADHDEQIRRCEEIQLHMASRGYRLNLGSNGHMKCIKWVDGFRLAFDMFISWSDAEAYWLYFVVVDEPIANTVFPLRSGQIRGVKFPIPDQPETSVVAQYGPSWRVPDPDFKDETTAAQWNTFSHLSVGIGQRRYWDRYYKNGKSDSATWSGSIPAEFGIKVNEGRVLDVGAGDGWLSAALAGSGNEVVALDYSSQALAVVSERAQLAGVAIEPVECNIRAVVDRTTFVAANQASFDCVYVIDVLPFLGERGLLQCIEACGTVASAGGRLVIAHSSRSTEDERASDSFQKADVAGLLQQYGWTVSESRAEVHGMEFDILAATRDQTAE